MTASLSNGNPGSLSCCHDLSTMWVIKSGHHMIATWEETGVPEKQTNTQKLPRWGGGAAGRHKKKQ